MSIKEIAERALQDVLSDCQSDLVGNVEDLGDGAAVIERAIREAAQPLVDALRLIHRNGHATEAEMANAALAEWRAK